MAQVDHNAALVKDNDSNGDALGGLDDNESMETLILKSGGDSPQSFPISRKAAELSKFVTTILEGDSEATTIEVRQVPAQTMERVIEYLQHHKGEKPQALPCPVRSITRSIVCA